MDTIENNKIIAEFMANKKGQIIYVKHLNAWFDDSMGYKYDKDYNWLMEVLDKIESLGCFIQIDSICVKISKKDIDILTVNNCSRIQAVYNACLEFIKYYSKQTEKESQKLDFNDKDFLSGCEMFFGGRNKCNKN